MKKFKSILILTFCFALLLTTTNVTGDYGVAPCGHYEDVVTKN